MNNIVASNICKAYKGVSVLDSLSLVVEQGELVALFGPESSGKTTLLRILAGLEQPDSGRFCVGGQEISELKKGIFSAVDSSQTVRMVFESGALWPHMTVYKNLAFILRTKGTARHKAKEQILECLAHLGAEHLAERSPRELNGLEYQRVALARALVGGARTILIDGFLGNLRDEQRAALRSDIRRIHREMNLTILFATSDPKEAFAMPQKVAILEKGRIAQVGPPSVVYATPCNLAVARITGEPPMNCLPAKAQVDCGLLTVQSALGIHQFTSETFTEHIKEEPLFDCMVGIRPERIAIYLAPDSGALPARISSSRLSSSETVVQLEVEDQLLTAKWFGAKAFAQNQPVYLQIRPEDISIFHLPTQRLIKKAAFPTTG